MLIALYPAAACAQALDYGTLEQIFGEPITTSAIGKPQRASDVPANMTIITQDDIRRSGADNIPDILQFVAGIDIRRYSLGDAQIAIRGYDQPLNPRLLVLVDGRQVYSDDYGYVAWNAIPVQLGEIRQIEVARGPNTALFGFNAASGVINIITYDPLLDNRDTATVRGGTQGYGQGEAVATQHFGSTAGVRVSAGGWTATGYPPPGAVSTPSPRYASFNLDGRWQITPNLLLSASGGATDAHTERNLGLTEDSQNRLSYGRAGAAAQTALGTIGLDVYRNETLADYSDAGYGNNTTYVVRASDLVPLNASNVFRGGLEYRKNSETSPDVGGGAISYDDFAANAMWNWRITPSVEFTGAVRADHLVLHGQSAPSGTSGWATDRNSLSEPSFNAGLVIHATDADTVRIMLSRGLQLPSLALFGLHADIAGVQLLGSPALAPTSVVNAELDYDRDLAGLGATLHGALFFQRNTALLVSPGASEFRSVSGQLVSNAENAGAGNELGSEIALRGTTGGGVRWSASYCNNAITDQLAPGLNKSAETTPDAGTPRHAVTLAAGYTRGRWEFDLQGRGQTKFTDFVDFLLPRTVPAYLSFNAHIGFRVTGDLTIAATAEQFNARRLLEGADSYIGRRISFSVTLAH